MNACDNINTYTNCEQKEGDKMKSDAGKILTDLRVKTGKSMREVADDLNISLSAISYYESGKRTPRDNIKSSLAQYYGVSVQDIFFA